MPPDGQSDIVKVERREFTVEQMDAIYARVEEREAEGDLTMPGYVYAVLDALEDEGWTVEPPAWTLLGMSVSLDAASKEA
jgi:hypothetical protein